MNFDGGTQPEDLPPQRYSKYHLTWNVGSTPQVGVHFHISERKGWLLLAAHVERFKREECLKKLELVNYLNLVQEMGTWVCLLKSAGFALQVHLPRNIYVYSKEALGANISWMTERCTFLMIAAEKIFRELLDCYPEGGINNLSMG